MKSQRYVYHIKKIYFRIMILVTGGTGLVGTHLLYQLCQQESNVRAIYRTKESIRKVQEVFSFYSEHTQALFKKIEWVRADVTSVPDMIPAFKNVTHVYHCAAMISFNPKDYIEMRKINIHGTAIVVNLSIDAKIKKLCYVSSIAAVGNSLDGNPIHETCEWDDQIDNYGYAITKYGGEMEVWRGGQEGIDVVVVNPGVILGPGFWQTGSGKLFSKVYNGLPFYTKGETGFIGVFDLVKTMQFLMNSEIHNERFILVSENKSWKTIFDCIATSFHKNKPTLKIGKYAMGLIWRLNWVLSKTLRISMVFTKHIARNSQRISTYSSEKIKQVVPYHFEKIETVIQKTCAVFETSSSSLKK